MAISGNHIVVGIPGAAAYKSTGQADASYQLNLGTAGGAVVFSLTGGTWVQDRLLMPDDNALPTDTSYVADTTPADWNRVGIQMLNGNIQYFGIGFHFLDDQNQEGGTVVLAPWMFLALADVDHPHVGPDHGAVSYSNRSSQPLTIRIPGDLDADFILVGTLRDTSGVSATIRNLESGEQRTFTTAGEHRDNLFEPVTRLEAGPHAIVMAADTFGGLANLSEAAPYLDNRGGSPTGKNIAPMGPRHVFLASNREARTSATVRNTFSLAGARWGSAVDIIGDQVFVGAAGKSRMAFYDLAGGDYTHWTATVGGFIDTPLRTTQYIDGSGQLGAELATRGANEVYVGSPSGLYFTQFIRSGGNWSADAEIQLPPQYGYGANETVDVAGNRLLVGPSSGDLGALLISAGFGELLGRFLPYL